MLIRHCNLIVDLFSIVSAISFDSANMLVNLPAFVCLLSSAVPSKDTHRTLVPTLSYENVRSE